MNRRGRRPKGSGAGTPFALRGWIASAFAFASAVACASMVVGIVDDAAGARASSERAKPKPRAVVVAAAGDIADDDFDAERTAQILDRLRPAMVLTTGDNAYDDGTLDDYRSYFEPTWGRHKARTRPAAGNHEYRTPGASGYFAYFGAAAGDPSKGYYSFDIGRWHLVALNSNCSAVGGCGPGSAQEVWLRRDLRSSRALCTLAYWHHPRFASGNYGDDPTFDAFWRALYEHRAELVLNGHDHNYQRYAPQDPDGNRDLRRGLRQFIVGTGGKNTRPVDPPPIRNRVAANGSTFGVLKLVLRPAGYEWQFVPVAGSTFADAGKGTCH